jgi:hypothetical protein
MASIFDNFLNEQNTFELSNQGSIFDNFSNDSFGNQTDNIIKQHVLQPLDEIGQKAADYESLPWWKQAFPEFWLEPDVLQRVRQNETTKKEQRKQKAFSNMAQDNSGKEAFSRGFFNALSGGMIENVAKTEGRYQQNAQRIQEAFNQSAEEHPYITAAGNITGYALPGMGWGKTASNIFAKPLSNIGSNVAKRAIEGAAAGAGMELVEGIMRKEDAGDIAKRTTIGAGLGAVGDVTVYGIGKGISRIIEKFKAGKTLTSDEMDTLIASGLDENKLNRELQDITPNTELPKPSSNIVSSSKSEPFSFKRAWDKFYTRVVDQNKPLKSASKEAFTKASNSKNAGGIVDYILKDGLVDAKGNKIGSSLKEVAEQIPKGKEKNFWEYMLQRHNIDRAREGKNVYQNYTPEMSAEAARRFEQANPELKTVADNITKWIDDFMQEWGVKAGTVDADLYKTLRDTYKSYIPTNRDFSTLEDAIPNGLSRKFVDQKGPVKKATGSSRDITDPLENIMNLVNRTVRTAKYNEVGQTLANSIRKAPEKLRPLAEIIPSKDGMFSNVDNIVTVMENGKPTFLQINDKMLLDTLNGLHKSLGNIKFVTALNNTFKSLITQKNPLFAIRNIFRDIPTAYVYGSESNPMKFGWDLLKAGKDVVSNSKNLQRYKAVGGGGANFFKSDNVAKSAAELTGREGILKKVAKAPIKAIESFNNLTETVPRLAEFNRVLEKTGNIDKALFAANDVTVNFSRGGDITKSVDRWVPYLNAGVQGLDKFFRGFKNPRAAVATLAKAGVSITVPQVAVYLINKDNPNYQTLDSRTKDAYFLLPNMFGEKDGSGYAKTFIKVPKSRELGVLFASLFERTFNAVRGEKDSFKGFGDTVATNFSPANPIENNIIAPFTYNLPTNKDFAGRSIVPQGMLMDGRSKYLQYDEKTTSLAKKIAEYAQKANIDLSPKQIDYVINYYSGVVGDFAMPAMTQTKDPTKVLTNQFVADPLYSNKEVSNFYDNLDKLKKKAVDKNILENIPSKKVTNEEKLKNKLVKASEEMSKINKEIRNLKESKDEEKIRKLRRDILNIARESNKMVQ